MKNVKKKLLINIFAAIVIIGVLFFVSFNLYLNSYFESEARKTIQNNIDQLEECYAAEFSSIFSSYLKYYSINDDHADELMNSQEIGEGKLLHTYFLENNLDENTVQSMSSGDSKYFFSVNSYTWTHPEYGPLDDYSEISDDAPLVEEKETYIVYVDIMPVVSFTKMLNWIFVAILVFVSVIMTFRGLRFGKKIESAQNNQNKFFQNASHELKTPLMSIQGYAEAIQADIMDHHSAADVIMNESERMSSLVEEILAISKIDSGQLKLNITPVDIREILYDCLHSQEMIFKKKGIEVNLDFDSEKVMAEADDVQLRRAFMNIISNDTRYCEKHITISCRKSRGQALVRFEDDGPGLDRETMEKIFARFYMGPNGKTGIGMALTKEIINLHKGAIKAENGKQGGTVFEIQLPAL